jgi:L-ascorbate metabolism protein UlaG (beta-lactamase superfamily)
MQLTKFGHACVRIDDGDQRLVIDPGGLTDPAALTAPRPS